MATRRSHLLLAAVLSAGILLSSSRVPAADSRPNIIVILSDGHAAHAIGAYGSSLDETPHLDRLAAEGMRFSNYFVTSAAGPSSRATLITGTYAHVHGVKTTESLDQSQPTLPKLLQHAGYHTALIGAWQLGTNPAGFDYWSVLPGQGRYRDPQFVEMGDASDSTLVADGTRRTFPGHSSDIITDKALAYLSERRPRDRPFALFYQLKAPDYPWNYAKRYESLYEHRNVPEPATLFDDYGGRSSGLRTTQQRIGFGQTVYPRETGHLEGVARKKAQYQRYIKSYLKCARGIDDGFGRLLDHLDRSGLTENTLVLYTSTHGVFLGEHGFYDGRFMYEEALRTPLLVRWPGVVRPGSVNHDLILNVDFAPLLLQVAGVEVPGAMQGESFLSQLRGQKREDWRRAMYYRYYFSELNTPPHYGIRTLRHKLIYYNATDEWELYDLRQDPMEIQNLYRDKTHAEVVVELKARLNRLQADLKDTDLSFNIMGMAFASNVVRMQNVPLQLVLHLKAPDTVERKDLDPSDKPISVGAWCTPTSGDGVILAHGGEVFGYSLYIREGLPRFAIRVNGLLHEAVGSERLALNEPVHLVGVQLPTGKLRLYMNGKPVGQSKGAFLFKKPYDPLRIGVDPNSHVGSYDEDSPFQGELSDIRVYWGTLDAQSIRDWAKKGEMPAH